MTVQAISRMKLNIQSTVAYALYVNMDLKGHKAMCCVSVLTERIII